MPGFSKESEQSHPCKEKCRFSSGFLVTPVVLEHKKDTKALKFRAKFVGCCTLYMNDRANYIPADRVGGFWGVLKHTEHIACHLRAHQTLRGRPCSHKH